MMDECEQEGDPEDSQGGRGGQLTAKQKRIEDPSEKTCIDLIVLGIPYKTSADTCKAYFEAYGEVVLFDVSLTHNILFKILHFLNAFGFDYYLPIFLRRSFTPYQDGIRPFAIN